MPYQHKHKANWKKLASYSLCRVFWVRDGRTFKSSVKGTTAATRMMNELLLERFPAWIVPVPSWDDDDIPFQFGQNNQIFLPIYEKGGDMRQDIYMCSVTQQSDKVTKRYDKHATSQPRHATRNVQSLLRFSSVYIDDMVGRYTEYTNVGDFIEHKLHRMVNQFAKIQRYDIANVLSDCLDDYLMGKHDIIFVDGWPHIVKEIDDKGKQE